MDAHKLADRFCGNQLKPVYQGETPVHAASGNSRTGIHEF
jgi:hypothetical protein